MPLPHFSSPAEVIAQQQPAHPVMCFCPEAFRAEARRFVAGFPGAVHYAVKANPHPDVLGWLVEGGVSGFDVASIAEIQLVRDRFGAAHCAFNHPVKSRADIERAYRDLGVRDFVIDHESELAKLADICGRDVTVEVRVARSNPEAEVDLNDKFGCDGQVAARLMREAADLGFSVAAAMHVGWQARNPVAWREAMALAAGAASAAGVTLAYANFGGGFPSVLMPEERRLEDFFEAIDRARTDTLPGTPLNCEPGSALVWNGAAVITQVVLRKDTSLHLTDGIYGTLNEVRFSRISPPAGVYRGGDEAVTGPTRDFTIFGPTCDSLDVLPTAVPLPAQIEEGDYVVFGWMGAYSNALRTDFNGLGQVDYVSVDRL